MSVLPYTSELNPATDLGTLLEFLLTQDNGGFLYRGQTRLWPGPLIPSAHRRYQKTGAIYTRDSNDYAESLRKVGQRFVGLVPVNWFHESLSLFNPPPHNVHLLYRLYEAGLLPDNVFPDSPPSFTPLQIELCITAYEMNLLQRLSNDRYLARALLNGPDAFESMLTPFELMIFQGRFPFWKQVIDHDHRVQIRDLLFMWPLGYLLGQSLSQQYGFSSEMLDVTTDLRVAAFFATHDAPQFSAPVQEGSGVIYRFLRPKGPSLPLGIGKYNFYSCPAVLDFTDLLSPFRITEHCENLSSEVGSFLVTSFKDNKRRWDALRVSPRIMATLRVARQSAALLVPDMIYVEQETRGARFNKTCILMAIEDCATREGTTVFYFRHRGDASSCSRITREYLWPNEEDAFFEMIGNALLASAGLQSGQILPNRIDLLDPGYRT